MKTNIVIIVIALCVTAGASYYTYDLGRQAGVKEATDVRNAFFTDTQRFPTAGGATAQQGGQRQGGQAQQGGQTGNPATAQFAQFLGGVQGTVEKVEGNTLTVSVQRGQQSQTVKVTMNEATTVQMQSIVPATVSDVKVGARILVGTDNAQRPQGQQGQGGQGGQGGQAQQGQGGQGGIPQIPSEVTARSIVLLPANTP